MIYLVRKPRYIKIIYAKLRQEVTVIFDDLQARAVVLETIVWGNIFSFGIKKTGHRLVPIVKVKKELTIQWELAGKGLTS